MRYLRTNTATRITVGPFFDKTDGVTPETGITVTSEKLTFMVDTAGVPTLVLDTAPTASGGSNDMVHVTNDDAGFYDLELAAADVNYLGRAMLAITDATVHCPVFHEFMILPAMIYDAMVLGTDVLQADVTQLLGTAWLTPAVAGTPDVNAKQHGGTAQTGRDIGASVLLSSGTGTGQLDFTSGVVKTNLIQILGTTLTETAGQIAAAFKQFFNIASPTSTMNVITTVTTTTTATNLTNAPTSGDLTATMKTSVTTASDAVAIKADTAAILVDTGTTLDGRIPAALTTNGNMKCSLMEIISTALTETAGQIAAAFKQFFDIASPTGTMKAITNVVTTTNLTTNNDKTGYSISGTKTTLDALNDVSTAQVNTEVDTAIADARLDELLNADSDIDGAAPPTVGSVFHELLTKTAGSFTYDQSTDSLEAIRDKETDIETDTAEIGVAGAGLTVLATQSSVNTIDDFVDTEITAIKAKTDNLPASPAATGDIPGVAAIADAVWDEDVDTSHQTAGTAGKKLDDAGGAADPWATAVPGAYGAGTAGKIIGDNINATISSRATQTIADTIATDVAGLDGATMRGTDNAALASVCTESRLSELDAANLPADIANIKTDTAATLIDTAEIGVAGAGLSNINLPDQVMNITGNITGNISGSVGSISSIDKTGYSLSAAGVDAILDEICETEGSYSLREISSILLAVLSGITTDSGATITIKTPNGNAVRVTATIDYDYNRTAVTLTP
jgi:hypothetical protein